MQGQRATVKHMRPARESKTKGTLIVEQHRPMMNKLSDAERQQLMRAGLRQADLGTECLRCIGSSDRYTQGDCQQVLPLIGTMPIGIPSAGLKAP